MLQVSSPRFYLGQKPFKGKMPQNTSKSPSLLGRLSASSRSSWISPKDVNVHVQLLHDSDSIVNEFNRTQPAQSILDYICEMKNIQEKDFLGLRYQDHNKHRYWVDLSRSINHFTKQFKAEIRKSRQKVIEQLHLRLRFRYYPANPAHIRDSALRYQLFVQLQRDLLHGRLYCPQTQAAELAALLLQAQIGDHEDGLPENYVSSYKLLLKQTPNIEKKIAVLHQQLKGKSTAEAELEFLEKASLLDTYAFDPYTIKDPNDPSNVVYVGASHKGIIIFHGTVRTHHIKWSDLVKVDYVGRELRIVLREGYQPVATLSRNGDTLSSSASESRKPAALSGPTTLKYLCPTGYYAKHLWVHILSQQAFFNEDSASSIKPKFSKPRIPLLTRGSTFRFPSRRVYRELEEINESLPLMTTSTMTSPSNGDVFHTDYLTTTSINSNTNDVDSLLNQSYTSVPIRYELPRQELRSEQPWLVANGHAKTSTLPIEARLSPVASGDLDDQKLREKNNNYANCLNHSVQPPTEQDDVVSNQASTSTRPIEVTPPGSPITVADSPNAIKTTQFTISPSDRNQTSFTVFLVKREELPSSGTSHVDEPSDAGLNADYDVPDVREYLERQFIENYVSDEPPGEPLASSTPRIANKVTFANGGPKQNGHSNGAVPKYSDDVTKKNTSSVTSSTKTTSSLTNTAFVVFLILLLLFAIIISVFERNEQNDWVENTPVLSRLRHDYYEPVRHYTLNQYRKYTGTF
ncbi:unnamed protein product [Caenorhabditis auriculariae]|uniref:FERM domain-containing protein n=1 Tax=Caenorhabditis auriculariae TaxID=2777116 RepID=A0A8S1HMJ1_9PELO|nr:unnamed protein product [Caenorhabditis auriculariae]